MHLPEASGPLIVARRGLAEGIAFLPTSVETELASVPPSWPGTGASDSVPANDAWRQRHHAANCRSTSSAGPQLQKLYIHRELSLSCFFLACLRIRLLIHHLHLPAIEAVARHLAGTTSGGRRRRRRLSRGRVLAELPAQTEFLAASVAHMYVDGHWALALLASEGYLLDPLRPVPGRKEKLVDAARKKWVSPGGRVPVGGPLVVLGGLKANLEALRPGPLSRRAFIHPGCLESTLGKRPGFTQPNPTRAWVGS